MCKESIECTENLNLLRDFNKTIVKDSDYWILEYLEKNPIIDVKRTSEVCNREYSKVNRTVRKFVDLGILKEKDSSKKKRCYY